MRTGLAEVVGGEAERLGAHKAYVGLAQAGCTQGLGRLGGQCAQGWCMPGAPEGVRHTGGEGSLVGGRL